MPERILALRKEFDPPDSSNADNFGKPRELNDGLYKKLFKEPAKHSIVSSSPKVFSAIHKNDFTDNFYISEDELEAYAQGLLDILTNENINAVLEEEANEAQIDLDDIALDDKDIKLSLYRSFKSIYDKWIANSGKSTQKTPTKGYFFNNYGQDDDRTLFDHFSFVNRGASDIGGQAIIDPNMLSELISTSNGKGPTESLYQVITNILSKNNFDFFPLPTYVKYSLSGEEDLLDMFRAIPDKINKVAPNPSFLCVYIGGNSRVLDIPRSSCDNENKIAFDYGNDGFDINDPTQFPKDVSEAGGQGLTAFKVRYGQEAQNHFKKIELDQTEFKETQESLLVIDALANPKQGNSPSQAGKGNNIYDMYLTRGYTCTVTAFGNLQIQNLMYFQLENVPMFRGSYLITNVKHTITPHNVETVFKGTRQPFVQSPIVVDPVSLLDLALSEEAIEGQKLGTLGANTNRAVGFVSSSFPSGGPPEIISTPLSKKTIKGIVVSTPPKQYKAASGSPLKVENVDTIVLHWTAGFNLHVDTSTSVGYQYTIDIDGTLWETNSIKNKSSHAGCPNTKDGPCHSMNSRSVGISYVGGIKYHQKLGVEGIDDSIHNFKGNRQDNDTHGYALTEGEWEMDELFLPYGPNGKNTPDTIKIQPKKQWDSLVNAILLAKFNYKNITNITSHHWTSSDKQDVRDEFPWARLINELKDKGFNEVRLVSDWPSTNSFGTGKTVYNKKLNLPENLFGPTAEEKQENT
jgi:N-acetyl-anhydromuramyl-L-alanine amidase AmpD